MTLTITRKDGESVHFLNIRENVPCTIDVILRNPRPLWCDLVIDAPRAVKILREELLGVGMPRYEVSEAGLWVPSQRRYGVRVHMKSSRIDEPLVFWYGHKHGSPGVHVKLEGDADVFKTRDFNRGRFAPSELHSLGYGR